MKRLIHFMLLLTLLLPALSATAAPPDDKKAKKEAEVKKEIADADVPRITVNDFKTLLAKKKKNVIIVDVRGKGGYTEKIKGAVQIPLDEIEARMKELPRDKEIVTYCS